MRCDVATHIGERNTSLGTEGWNQALVDIGDAHWPQSDQEEEVDDFTGLPIGLLGTLRTNLLPCGDGFADDAIHRLREGGAGLVDGNVEQTDCIRGQHLSRAWDSGIVSLPTDTAETQANNLVAAETGEEPGQGESPAQLNGVAGRSIAAAYGRAAPREILGCQVQSGPD